MSIPKTPTPSEFTRALTRISVAQILKSTGFKSAKSSAFQTLTRVAALFLNHLTKSAASRTSFSGNNPALNDVLSALEDLDFPLDFSIPQLAHFITDSDNLPFPRRVPKPDDPHPSAAAVVPECNGGLRSRRRPEIPLWLPAFPQITVNDDSDDNGVVNSNNDDDDENVKGKEVYWEERRVRRCVLPAPVGAKEEAKEKGSMKRKRGKGEILVYRRRQRLKFRFGFRKQAKAGSLDDLELRNGVCRGGKRICLVKRGKCNSIFDDDDGGK